MQVDGLKNKIQQLEAQLEAQENITTQLNEFLSIQMQPHQQKQRATGNP